MDWKSIGDFVGSVGIPGFIAIFVIVRLEPSMKKLRDAITSLTVVTARTNGMAGKDVAEIIRLVAKDKDGRRIEDKVDGIDSKEKKE